MNQKYSNAEDCYNLAKFLKCKLGKKIEYNVSPYNEVVSGYYTFLDDYGDIDMYHPRQVSFYFKYLENEFLKIGIEGNGNLGVKLAALSDFYAVLEKYFGLPTFYYTIENDENKGINLQWSFKNAKNDLNYLKQNIYFDDGFLSELIIFDKDRNKEKEGNISLPNELIPLVNKNIHDFNREPQKTRRKIFKK